MHNLCGSGGWHLIVKFCLLVALFLALVEVALASDTGALSLGLSEAGQILQGWDCS